jgi:hypothetical protein
MTSMTAITHATRAALDAALPDLRTTPRDDGVLEEIVLRPTEGERELPTRATLTPEEGLVGDRWAPSCKRLLDDGRLNPDTQITLMGTRILALVAGTRDRWQLAGDQLLVDLDLGVENLPVGQRLAIGDAVLEITAEPHTGCAKFSSRFGSDALKFINAPEGRTLRLRGVNAQVVQAGEVAVGDRVRKLG